MNDKVAFHTQNNQKEAAKDHLIDGSWSMLMLVKVYATNHNDNHFFVMLS